MIQALTPAAALDVVKKGKNFPDFVIQAFNELIQENFQVYGSRTTAGSSRIAQNKAIDRIIALSDGAVTRNIIFDKGYLDVETFYRENGWKVEYDGPAYNESYEASFTFKTST